MSIPYIFLLENLNVCGSKPLKTAVTGGRTFTSKVELSVVMKIPPHPTQLQVFQQSQDLTYCKNYLHFQIYPGNDHVPFERNSSVTVGQQSYKLPMQRRQ